jgi:hypothetical protein
MLCPPESTAYALLPTAPAVILCPPATVVPSYPLTADDPDVMYAALEVRVRATIKAEIPPPYGTMGLINSVVMVKDDSLNHSPLGRIARSYGLVATASVVGM